MKLILTEDYAGLGTVGDVISVKGGYARNYLLPRALGVVADESNTRELDHRKRLLAKKKARILGEAKEFAAKLGKVTLVVQKQLGEDERIFGSVTTAEVARLLEEKGFPVDKKQISLLGEIKKAGTYTAKILVHSEVTANVLFRVEQVSA